MSTQTTWSCCICDAFGVRRGEAGLLDAYRHKRGTGHTITMRGSTLWHLGSEGLPCIGENCLYGAEKALEALDYAG